MVNKKKNEELIAKTPLVEKIFVLLRAFLILGIFPAIIHYYRTDWHIFIWMIIIPIGYMISICMFGVIMKYIMSTSLNFVAKKAMLQSKTFWGFVGAEVALREVRESLHSDIKIATNAALILQCCGTVAGWITCLVIF